MPLRHPSGTKRRGRCRWSSGGLDGAACDARSRASAWRGAGRTLRVGRAGRQRRRYRRLEVLRSGRRAKPPATRQTRFRQARLGGQPRGFRLVGGDEASGSRQFGSFSAMAPARRCGRWWPSSRGAVTLCTAGPRSRRGGWRFRWPCHFAVRWVPGVARGASAHPGARARTTGAFAAWASMCRAARASRRLALRPGDASPVPCFGAGASPARRSRPPRAPRPRAGAACPPGISPTGMEQRA